MAGLLAAGWSKKGRRLMGMKILLALPMLLFFLPLLGLAGIALWPLINAIMNGNEPGPEFFASIFAFFIGICCFGIIIFVFSWLLSLIGNYAARAIVLQELNVMAGIGKGWKLFKNHAIDSIILSILLAMIGFILGIIISIVTLIQGILIVIPLFLFLQSQNFPLMLTIASVIAGLFLMGILPALLTGPVLAYFESVWTLAWQHLELPDDKAGE